MKSKLTLLFFLFMLNCFCQFSKTHYLPPVSSGIIDAGNQYMYISTSSITPVNFSIIQLGTNTPIKGTVSRDVPYEFFISAGNDSQAHVPQNKVHQVLNDKGYVIEAEDLVAVSIRIGSGDVNRNHASSIVSKGLAALGKQFRIGSFINPGNYSSAHYTFVSILATENNTRVSFSNIDTGVNLINNNEGSNPSDIILNSGQSFVLGVHGGINSVRDGLIGALVSSDKPIALNCGSFGGSNGLSNNLDMGFDQIVPAERLKVSDISDENKYIFIKSDGWDDVERVLLIAHENNTEIYLNGNPTPNFTLNAGNYVVLNGINFNSNSNLYVRSTKPIFAYQSIGDQKIINSNSGQEFQANQEMFFVPPLSCQTPNNINNIPMIEKLGNDTFGGRITIVTKKGSNLTFKINGVDYTYANVPSSSKSGPNPVTGNNDYETYTIIGLTGNISVFSTSEVYIAAYGNNGAATFGGYYSGFTFEPEITFEKLNLTSENCIPNVKLSVNTATSFDTFEWSFNDGTIGGNTNSFTPTQPGYYKVKASISTCPSFGTLESDEIPVSSCPTNLDNDLANDNIDIDNDNDGILNCIESFGDQNINTTVVTAGIINNSPVTYNGTFTATTNTTNTFNGNSNGNIITETPAGKTEQVTYKLDFTSPITIGVDYPIIANASDLLNANAEYTISTNTDKTITVLNPTNQLLIDTNYDGIFESGITQFSSFEIRFRLNGNVPLQAGTGTFKFLSYKITKLEIKHRNLSDAQNNRSTFRIFASCVEKDTDNDGTPDQLDTDSDDDGISDLIEAQSNSAVTISNSDTDLNGLDNAFEPGFTPFDNDSDGIPDYLDLDSDNDGILDSTEKGDDLDSDGVKNYRDLDSDADDCFDVKEAGFSDLDNDGIFGTSPITPTANGLVNGAPYTTPNNNYLTSAPIVITSQPADSSQCLFESTTFQITSNADSFQWQFSTDNGANWNNLPDDATYDNITTNILTINNLQNSMDGYQYRVKLNRTGNGCDFFSDKASLFVYQLPILEINKELIQCTNTNNGFANFNLTKVNSLISTNHLNETFSYFHTEMGARTNDVSDKITDDEKYTNLIPNSEVLWARVTNSNNCFNVISFEIYVSTASALFTLPKQQFNECDDYVDALNDDYDGISSFDLTENYNFLIAFFNNPDIDITFYKNEIDYDKGDSSLAITDLINYRNIGYPNLQKIWVRVENKKTKACLGTPATFDLIVEPKPNINVNKNGDDNTHICTDDTNVYQTLTAGLPKTENPNDYTYVWERDDTTTLPEVTPSISVNTAGKYKVIVSYKAGLQCSRSREILVEESNTAQIVGTPIIKDLVDNNSVTVTVTGDGNYVFALDDQFGPTQTTGYFDNLTPGIHTVFVIDLYGCAVLEVPVPIVGFPKYFTPNGDGYHDTWNIIGANSSFNANTKILIYNRYGKLLKEILPLGNGWDGHYLGKPVPADDYWFTAELKDGRNVKGHFSLKR